MKNLYLFLILLPSLLMAQIELDSPTPYRLCDANSDGAETFDLSTKNSEILGTLDPALHSIAYFGSLTDANANVNALNPNYTNTSFPQIIWARVWENANVSNFDVVSFTLQVQALPNATVTESADFCTNDFGYFMLAGSGGTAPYTFHYTINGGPEQVITTGMASSAVITVQNNVAATYTIAVTKVTESGLGCARNLSLTNSITVHPNTTFVDPSDLVVTDSPFDGVSTFDLTGQATIALNGQANHSALFYLSAADAANGVAPLTQASASAFQNTVNPQTIWIAIVNDATGCRAITDFKLIVTPPDSGNVYIPDAAFKVKLLEASPSNTIAYGASGYGKIDTNDDGEIQLTEAQAVTKLNVSYSTIVDLTGVEKFTNLKYLESINNLNLQIADVAPLVQLDSLRLINGKLTGVHLPAHPNLKLLDIQGNDINSLTIGNSPNLEYFAANDNELTSLDLSPFVDLKSLIVVSNNLSSLDLQAQVNLEWLACGNNQIYTLNLQNLGSLQYLNCTATEISALDLSPTPNLTVLRASGNDIPSLDLSFVPNLVELTVDYNKLSTLDVSGMTSLKFVTCNNNDMTSIDVSGCTNLEKLKCDINQISTLDLQNLANLKLLECGINEMTSLNVTGCTGLLNLDCSSNNLTTIDLSTLESLQVFSGSMNLFAELDFSNNPLTAYYSYGDSNYVEATSFALNPNLVSVNFKNGNTPNWGSYTASALNGLDNLIHICVDEAPEELLYYNVFVTGGISVNSYCSFTPGGDYNTITGHMAFDGNNNGCDASDLAQPFLKVLLNDGVATSAAFASSTGDYTFYTGAGNFTVTPDLENPSFFNYSPVNANVNFPLENSSVSNQPFCITPNGTHHDVEVVLAPVTPARPGFDADYKLVYKNKGNQIESGTIVLDFDATVLQLLTSVPSPDNQSTGQLTFNYSNLAPFANREILFTMHVNSPMDTPAVNVGDVLEFTTQISQIGTDDTPNDNTFNFNQVVVGSFDPNDMICIEGDLQPVEQIGNYLHYITNFENTGTYPAENIVVKTVFDPAQYEVSSLRVLNASNDVDVRVEGNKVEYVFEGINLAIGGHGNILLKVKTRDNLSNGDSVANRADIFFDYNLPITTNDAETTFQMLSVGEVDPNVAISVSPNPTGGQINITSSATIQSVQIFDVQGRLLQTALRNDASVLLDISERQSGVYFVKVLTNKEMSVQKVVKK